MAIKFSKIKYEDPQGMTTVALNEDSTETVGFAILATQKGVNFMGKLANGLRTQDDLQSFAKAMSDAWTEHLKLKPRLSTTVSGH